MKFKMAATRSNDDPSNETLWSTDNSDFLSVMMTNSTSHVATDSATLMPVGNEGLRYYVNSVVIPLLLTFGAIGNTISLMLLAFRPCRRLPLVTVVGMAGQASWPSSRRRKVSLQPLERVAMVGLGALAVSDLAFCLVGIPAGVLAMTGVRHGDVSTAARVAQEYKVYRSPLHNMFLFSSTWITVFVAVERFFAVINPLRARWYLKVKHGVIFSAFIFLAAATISSPLFFRLRFVTVNCTSVECTKWLEPTPLFLDVSFRAAYIVIWTALGTFIPLAVLVVSSAGLAAVLFRSRARGVASPARYPCLRVTATVTAVVVTYIALVCPSMLLEAIWLFNSRWASSSVNFTSSISNPSTPFRGATHLTIMLVTNLTQSVWFSANFLLYFGCSIGRHFRTRRPIARPTSWRLTARQGDTMASSSIKRNFNVPFTIAVPPELRESEDRDCVSVEDFP